MYVAAEPEHGLFLLYPFSDGVAADVGIFAYFVASTVGRIVGEDDIICGSFEQIQFDGEVFLGLFTECAEGSGEDVLEGGDGDIVDFFGGI